MNAGATAERVYEALRATVMQGEIRPGERLDPARLCAELNSSVTPVREALYRLLGEGLVEARQGLGFHLPLIDDPTLRDLYRWSAQLSSLSLRLRNRGPIALWDSDSWSGADNASRTQRIFVVLGRLSGNGEHLKAIEHLGARMHGIRMAEARILVDAGGELDELEQALGTADFKRLSGLIATYHRRRERASSAILRAIYKAL